MAQWSSNVKTQTQHNDRFDNSIVFNFYGIKDIKNDRIKSMMVEDKIFTTYNRGLPCIHDIQTTSQQGQNRGPETEQRSGMSTSLHKSRGVSKLSLHR